MDFSNKARKLLFYNINKLSSTEHDEIYRIITENSVNVSRNKNGVFFNLTSISDETVGKIDAFVTFCLSNQDELDEYDKKLNECKMNNKYSNLLSIHGNHSVETNGVNDVQLNISLENLSAIQCAEKEAGHTTPWQCKLDAKSTQKIVYLLDRMHEDKDRLHSKKANSKFMNAKKRYSKKVDKKFDLDLCCELEAEKYIT